MLDVVTDSKLFGVRASQELMARVKRPSPRRPNHRDKGRFHRPERDVYDEALDLLVRYRRQVIGDGIYVPVVQVLLALNLRPGAPSERAQICRQGVRLLP